MRKFPEFVSKQANAESFSLISTKLLYLFLFSDRNRYYLFSKSLCFAEYFLFVLVWD